MIKFFLNWIKASFEEKDGRSSGKSISAFVFVVCFVGLTIGIFYTTIKDIYIADSQKNLIELAYECIVWLVLGLYSVKIAGKSRFFKEKKEENTNDENIENK